MLTFWVSLEMERMGELRMLQLRSLREETDYVGESVKMGSFWLKKRSCVWAEEEVRAAAAKN